MTSEDLAVKQAAWLLRSQPDEDDVGLRVRTVEEGRHRSLSKLTYAYEGEIVRIKEIPGYDYKCQRSPRSRDAWPREQRMDSITLDVFYANKKDLVLSDWEDE